VGASWIRPPAGSSLEGTIVWWSSVAAVLGGVPNIAAAIAADSFGWASALAVSVTAYFGVLWALRAGWERTVLRSFPAVVLASSLICACVGGGSWVSLVPHGPLVVLVSAALSGYRAAALVGAGFAAVIVANIPASDWQVSGGDFDLSRGPGLYLGSMTLAMMLVVGYVQLARHALSTSQAETEEAMRALRESTISRDAVARILEGLAAPVIAADIDGRLVGLNLAAERAIGDRRDAVLGRALDTILSDGPEGSERWLCSREGRIPVSVAETLLEGETSARIMVLTDLRARKAEEASLKAAAEYARQADQAKGEFLANMSHELRTPLNAILGYTELVREDVASAGMEPSVEDLDRVRSSALHLLGLINDVLDLSKIESGNMVAESVDFPVRSWVRSITDSVRPAVTRNESRLVVTVDERLSTVVTDETRLRQIALNLLSNAAKFTNAGTVTLDVRGRDDALVLTVTDTGIGMTQEQLGRVFEPFRQADASTARRFGGTGLGLALSRRFCALLGGALEVQSAPGVGSTFTVRVPGAVRHYTPAG
jgi:signal transduction histidine kinase